MSEKDTTILLVEPEASTIPDELKARPQWVCWTLDDEGRDSLFDPRNHTAASRRDPDTCGTFDQALTALQAYMYDGIGFVFSEDDPYCGIKLVNVRNPETGTIEPWAAAIVQFFNCYTEIAPSGRDLQIFARGTIPKPLFRSRQYEDGQTRMFVIRDHGFDFPITGNRLAGTPSARLRLPRQTSSSGPCSMPKPWPRTKTSRARLTLSHWRTSLPLRSSTYKPGTGGPGWRS